MLVKMKIWLAVAFNKSMLLQTARSASQSFHYSPCNLHSWFAPSCCGLHPGSRNRQRHKSHCTRLIPPNPYIFRCWGQCPCTQRILPGTFRHISRPGRPCVSPVYRWCLNKTISIQDGAKVLVYHYRLWPLPTTNQWSRYQPGGAVRNKNQWQVARISCRKYNKQRAGSTHYPFADRATIQSFPASHRVV